MFKEFREFAFKGNLIDMAVGIMIGGAFATVVKSLVDNVFMPPLGMLLAQVDFKKLQITLKPAVEASEGVAAIPAVTLNYGQFISVVINFVIVAAAIFVLVRVVSRFDKESAPPPPTTKDCPQCRMAVPLAATKCGHCTSPIPA